MRNGFESLARITAPLLGIALLCAQPVLAVSAKPRLQPGVTTDSELAGFRTKSQALVLQPMNLDVSRFAFTAPGRVASSRVQVVERGFSFTPSNSSKGVSVGASVRSVTPSSASERTASADGIAPAGYNFDLSVGYRGISLTGGVSRLDNGLGGRSSEGVDVGVGFGKRNWQAAVEASAQRDTAWRFPQLGTPDPRYALEARGAYALSPKVSLGGSFRYRLAPENPTPLDPDKDDRAVMLGGAVAF